MPPATVGVRHRQTTPSACFLRDKPETLRRPPCLCKNSPIFATSDKRPRRLMMNRSVKSRPVLFVHLVDGCTRRRELRNNLGLLGQTNNVTPLPPRPPTAYSKGLGLLGSFWTLGRLRPQTPRLRRQQTFTTNGRRRPKHLSYSLL